MDVNKFINTLSDIPVDIGEIVVRYKITRSFLLKKGERLAFKKLVVENKENRPIEMQKEKKYFTAAS
ncbi:MAG: hypothetical protein KAW82_06975 [Desulfurellaceae bacterium]|nr:hypothetical protein [Desulfurellaceae bacterium]